MVDGIQFFSSISLGPGELLETAIAMSWDGENEEEGNGRNVAKDKLMLSKGEGAVKSSIKVTNDNILHRSI